MKLGKFSLTLAVVLSGSTAAFAQSYSAGGGAADQAAYSMLSTQIGALRDAMNSVSSNLKNELSKFKKCAAKQMLYAPTATGADSDGCAAVAGNGKSCAAGPAATVGETGWHIAYQVPGGAHMAVVVSSIMCKDSTCRAVYGTTSQEKQFQCQNGTWVDVTRACPVCSSPPAVGDGGGGEGGGEGGGD